MTASNGAVMIVGVIPRALTLRPPRRRASRPVLLGVLVALLAALLLGCREEVIDADDFVPRERPTAGEPRSYKLGFSDIPPVLTDDAYLETLDLTADFGEVLLLQRPPSWGDFVPGVRVSDELRDQTLAEREAARARGLTMVIALDPFDPGDRSRLNRLPSGYQGRDLSDADLRTAFVNEAVFLAHNVRPAYLVLGTEVNVAFERNPEGYLAFVRAYHEAYDAVKEAAPEVQVLVSFQYEELLGVVPGLPPHAPRWGLLEDFEGRLDLLGITTYPSFAYPVARKVPPHYYLEIREHTDLPVGFISAGYTSAAGRDGINSSTPPEQRRFLQRLLQDADELESPLLIWFVARDMGFAASSQPYDVIAHIGLRETDDEPKEAWQIWEQASNRPYDPEAARVLAQGRRDAATPTPTPEPEDLDGGESDVVDPDLDDDESTE